MRRARLIPLAASLAALAACATTEPTPIEAELLASATPEDIAPATSVARSAIAKEDPITRAAFWGEEYDKNPGDLEAARAFTESLREIGSFQRAAEVAAQAMGLHGQDLELAVTLGRSLVAMGDAATGREALRAAHGIAPQDWRPLAALGVANDQLGRHAEARKAYTDALLRNPDALSVRINMALSHALEGDPVKAEALLRDLADRPDADPRVRQNLALVVGLQGRFDEAQRIAGEDLPPEIAAANADSLRDLLAPRERRWDALRGRS